MSLTQTLMHDLLGTEAGLLSLAVIAFIPLMAVWIAIYIRRRMASEGQPVTRRGR